MNPTYDVVRQFEQRVADYCGAKYGVAVDTCSAALQLCCEHVEVAIVRLPKRTYISVPFAILHAGGQIEFADIEWTGAYQLSPYLIVDAAMRFTKGMYAGHSYVATGSKCLMCLSFHSKKILPIGRGGMIVTNDLEAVKWLREMRHDGRNGQPFDDKADITRIGWPFAMEPERAARGMVLMDHLPDHNEDLPNTHPDISGFTAFKA